MDMKLLNDLCEFILLTSAKYKIDESHDISHSMDVLHNAYAIYEIEKDICPIVKEHRNIIYIAAALHDMCDKKYMDEKEGIKEIETFLESKISDDEMDVILSIITTMSYSTVKTNGYPDLGIYQTAYHIVREADLLSAYNFDRCVIYGIKAKKDSFETTFARAETLFNERVLRHGVDNLFTTKYALNCFPGLHFQAMERINTWKRLLQK